MMSAQMNRRECIIGSTLIVGGMAGFAVKPTKPVGSGADLKGILSASIGNWTRIERSLDSVPQPSAYTQSIYEEVVAGHFVSPEGSVVTLLLAYNRSQNYASQLHRPDICYPASGFKILRQKDIDISLQGRNIKGRIIDTIRGTREERVLFWTRIGSQYPRSLTQQRLEIFRAAFSGKNNDGIVVRFSTPASTIDDSDGILLRFAREFTEGLPKEKSRLLIGHMPNFAPNKFQGEQKTE